MIDSPVEEIKARLSITDVLGEYIQMKKAGTNFKAVCPFHSEKTPSFMISPSKQIWHCFGCGLGGDIFEFIKNAENVDFAQALRILADKAGVELKKPTAQDIQLKESKDLLYDINELAADYYAKVLWQSGTAVEALDYLRKRGLTDQTIKKWKIGWAPEDYHYLENFLAKFFSKPQIEKAGLIIRKDNLPALPTGQAGGRQVAYFDRFHGRIMFPIADEHGRVVGFTGRLLREKENAGKYVNSPETEVYNKSRVIFGLNQAKNSIRKEDRAVIVEGQLDVITSHQAGFTQTVASSGTAFTEDQLRNLHRLTKNLVFAFDSDKAGMMAAERTLQSALKLGFNVRVVNITGAKDPDEVIKKGIGLWQKHLDSAVYYIDFMINEAMKNYNAADPEGIAKIESKIIPLISYIENSIVKAHYVRKLSELLKVNEKFVFNKLAELGKPQVISVPEEAKPKKNRRDLLEDQLLGLVLQLKNPEELAGLALEDFNEENREVFRLVLENKFSAESSEKDLSYRIDLLSFAAKVEVEERAQDPKIELKRVASEFKRMVWKQKLEQIAAELGNAEKERNKPLVDELSKKAADLTVLIAGLK
jgi:DNA primase